MCLITKQKDYKIAKKDIPVWKILNNDDSAKHFSDFIYTKGELNKTRMKKVPRGEKSEILNRNKGWKAMNSDVIAIYYDKLGNWGKVGHPDRDKLTCIGQGFHAITKKKMATDYHKDLNSFSNKLVKFIIPKGAKYYKDVADCNVSNQIKML